MYKIIGDNIDNLPYEECKDDNKVIWRYSKNPIIKRNPSKGISRVFNSAVLPYKDGFVGIFRGDGMDTIPYLYVGYSTDGINFDIEPNKIEFIKNGEPYKMQYGYDPRLLKFGDEYFIMWCDGFEGFPSLGLAKTKDFKSFVMLDHPFLPYNRNGVLFPRKINNQYYVLSRPSDNGHTAFGDIFLSRSNDLEYWGKHELVMRKGYQWWQSLKIGAGCPPIETNIGWLIIYHGATLTCNGYVYSMGAAILDIDNPSKVLHRCKNFVFTPEADYETNGFVPNVVFPCSALCDSKTGRISIYYGCADTYVGLCFTTVDKLINYILENDEIG